MKDEITLVCSAIVVLLCGAGIWSSLFRDNWAQFIGLSILEVAAIMVGWHAYTTERSSTRTMLLMIGLALYGLGTARKAWRYRGQAHDGKPAMAEPSQ